MGQCGHFTHVCLSRCETQVFRRLTVVSGTPRDLGCHIYIQNLFTKLTFYKSNLENISFMIKISLKL